MEGHWFEQLQLPPGSSIQEPVVASSIVEFVLGVKVVDAFVKLPLDVVYWPRDRRWVAVTEQTAKDKNLTFRNLKYVSCAGVADVFAKCIEVLDEHRLCKKPSPPRRLRAQQASDFFCAQAQRLQFVAWHKGGRKGMQLSAHGHHAAETVASLSVTTSKEVC